MKNGWIIWNVVLTLVAGFLLVRQFGSNSKKSDNKGAGVQRETGTNQFRMAYFEMDSVAAHFEMVKEVKAELTKKEEEINRQIDGELKRYQQRFFYYQNQARDGKLSQAQQDSAGIELKKMDDDLKLLKDQKDQEYNSFMARKQNEIKMKIENFLKDYNKTHNYSYIVSYEQGLFYFKDTAFNITDDVIRGLNESYKVSAKR
jgi:outer membrane protein